jgi:ADP-ribose pyrophosphatase YjhB (NUDIX family)
MKESAGIIVKVGDECLVCQRASENSEPGKWAIPMGGIENGESSEIAAYREFHEEMGINLNLPIKHIARVNRYNKMGFQKSILHVYICEPNGYLIPNLERAKDGFEHTSCEYMNKEEIEDLNMSNGIKEILLNFL